MKVCILTAGVGSRMGEISNSLNKAILPTNEGAIISEIIKSFDKDTKFIIAVGYKSRQVKDYISIAHKDLSKNISFKLVDNFDKKFSGPGYSLFKCKNFLNEPFFVISCDTIIPNKIKLSNNLQKKNILFGNKVAYDLSKEYCNLEVDHKNKITKILEKKKYKNSNYFSFSGLIYVYDFKQYWESLSRVINKKYSPQLSDGLPSLLKKKEIYFKNIDWIDVGKFKLYQKYINQNTNFDFSKKNEAIYIINGKVIKYFKDKNIVNQRFNKSKKIKNIFPVLKKKNNFYYYNYAEGKTLYEVRNNTKIFSYFVNWAHKKLWIKSTKDKQFQLNCRRFYKDKTYKRLSKILLKYKTIDKYKINESSVSTIRILLKKIDWNNLINGKSYFIHGDLQFDNILYRGNKNFLLLDWRHSFGNYVNKGDIYYDIAKLLGGILINYKKIKMNKFIFEEKKNKISYKILEDHSILKNNFQTLYRYIIKERLNLKKIYTLTALIYLNMSPLHHYPFDKILFGLSKEILSDKNFFEKYETDR